MLGFPTSTSKGNNFQGKVVHDIERNINIAGCLPKLILFSFALLV